MVIEKIDSQGPTVKAFKQIGNQPAVARDLQANIEDYKDLTEQAGSGIASVYVMTTYPYKDGKLNPNPDKTYDMRFVNGKWISEKAISVPYDGTNDVWLVTEDNVGNQRIYSTQVTNMIGVGDDEGNVEKPKPDDPTKPEDPSKPDQPNQPDHGGNETTKPNQPKDDDIISRPSDKGVSGSTNKNDNPQIGVVGNEVKSDAIKKAEGLTSSEETLNTLKDIQSEMVDNPGRNPLKVVYVIVWSLLIVVVGWAILLYYRYRKLKKELASQAAEQMENEREDK